MAISSDAVTDGSLWQASPDALWFDGLGQKRRGCCNPRLAARVGHKFNWRRKFTPSTSVPSMIVSLFAKITPGESFDRVTARAAEFEATQSADQALVAWLRDMVALTYDHRGLIATMTAAIDDETSALHGSCVLLKASGARLLARAQGEGRVRPDLNGTDLLALVSALAWLNDQAPFAARVEHLFGIIATAILTKPGKAAELK